MNQLVDVLLCLCHVELMSNHVLYRGSLKFGGGDGEQSPCMAFGQVGLAQGIDYIIGQLKQTQFICY